MKPPQPIAFLSATEIDLRKAADDLMQQLEYATREAGGRPILSISHTCQYIPGGGYFLTALVTFEGHAE